VDLRFATGRRVDEGIGGTFSSITAFELAFEESWGIEEKDLMLNGGINGSFGSIRTVDVEHGP